MATKELVRPNAQDAGIRVVGSPVFVPSPTLTAEMTSASQGTGSDVSAVEQIMSINRKLVVQIETLRLKVDVDRRQHERVTTEVVKLTQRQKQLKELEIENLRTELQQKAGAVHNLSSEFSRKEGEVISLQTHLDELKEDMKESKVYVEEMQAQITRLIKDKEKLESGEAYREKDEQITKLQKEVTSLQVTMETMEKELRLAKDKISQQGSKLRHVDVERTNLAGKFKEEMAKVSQNVRQEVEMTREVMLKQWKEIKALREENDVMRTDLREIKELLTSDLLSPNVYGHAMNPYTLQPPSPSLPAINKGNKQRNVPKKK